MFWLGEYANILLMCAMGSILFLGGWLPLMDIYRFEYYTPSSMDDIENFISIFIICFNQSYRS